MAWLTREKAPIEKSEKLNTPAGLWIRCKSCQEIIFHKDFAENLRVCPKCTHHFPISPGDRIAAFVDSESFEELDADLCSSDPLAFKDVKDYKSRLKDSANKTRRQDALVAGEGKLHGKKILIGVFDFQFMGGSMGSVVGEKIARLFIRGKKQKNPVIIVSSSGGARMQEGILSLMQMAKTCAALAQMREAGVPFVSVLTQPTTGGVAASFALLGDVNIGEPGALIGFAGPRVIQQTIREELPEGFQTAEFLLDHGMLDMICHRDALRDTISQILDVLQPHPGN